jgi:hypothetical protein
METIEQETTKMVKSRLKKVLDSCEDKILECFKLAKTNEEKIWIKKYFEGYIKHV